MNKVNKKVFKCEEPQCEYETARKFNLDRHMLYHAGEQVNTYYCLACDEAIKDTGNVTKHKWTFEHCENVRENFPKCCKVRCCSILGVSCLLKVQKKYVNKYIIKKQTTTYVKTVKVGKAKAEPVEIIEEEEDEQEVEDFTEPIKACKKKIESMIKEISSNKLNGLIEKRIVDMKQWTNLDESTYFKYNDLESQLEQLL
jgi:hypothetical protein